MSAAREYRLVARLADTDYGESWRGVATGPEGPSPAFVALLAPHAAEPDVVAALVARVEALSSLMHPGLSVPWEVGRAGGRVVLTAPYVDGHDLGTVFSRQRAREIAVSLGRAVSVIAEAADAVATLHGAGVPHQSIAPTNVFVCPDGQVRVTCANVHPALEVSKTARHLALRGRKTYRAPELARSGAGDVLTDVYGLGALLYELSTGKRLDAAGGRGTSTRPDALPSPSRVDRRIPVKFDAVVEKALQTARTRRDKDAAVLRDSLLAWLTAMGHALSRDELAELAATVMPNEVVRFSFDPNEREDPAAPLPAGFTLTPIATAAAPGPRSYGLATEAPAAAPPPPPQAAAAAYPYGGHVAKPPAPASPAPAARPAPPPNPPPAQSPPPAQPADLAEPTVRVASPMAPPAAAPPAPEGHAEPTVRIASPLAPPAAAAPPAAPPPAPPAHTEATVLVPSPAPLPSLAPDRQPTVEAAALAAPSAPAAPAAFVPERVTDPGSGPDLGFPSAAPPAAPPAAAPQPLASGPVPPVSGGHEETVRARGRGRRASFDDSDPQVSTWFRDDTLEVPVRSEVHDTDDLGTPLPGGDTAELGVPLAAGSKTLGNTAYQLSAVPRRRHRGLAVVGVVGVLVAGAAALALTHHPIAASPSPEAKAAPVTAGATEPKVDLPAKAAPAPAKADVPVPVAPPRHPSEARAREVRHRAYGSRHRRVYHGRLSVYSRHRARVYLDGRDLHRHTPLRYLRVTSGHHEVKIVDPVSGLTRRTRIYVRTGHLTRVHLRL